jgi:hypothetical protein
MNKKFFLDTGGYMQEMTAVDDNPKLVPFPVYLAVKYGDNSLEEYHDFILNITESCVFVRTEYPLPLGTFLIMHFYIPPGNKLLSEIKGRVQMINQHHAAFPKGMLIKFGFFSRNELKNLENYVEGKKHLTDKII